MYRRKAGGCLPFFSSPWYKSVWNPPHPSMYHAVEPLPYSDHSSHRLVVCVCWSVSKLLSHDPSACAPCLLFCWSSSNRLPHPTVPRRLSIFIAHRTSFPVRLLPCENCLICSVVPFRGNIFASNSLVCLDVGFFICRFSTMRFHLDQKRCCSCWCSFSQLFNCF